MKTFFFALNALFVGVEVFLLLAIHQKNQEPAPSLEPLPAAPAPVIREIPTPAIPAPRALPFQPDADALLVRLIKEREGFHSRPYRCPAGVLTIGYGFTAAKYVRRESMTEKEASRILLEEIIPAAKKIVRDTVRVPLTPYQEAALASFAFNCGEGNLKKLVKNRLNAGDYNATASALLLYVKADGKTLRGLVERRKQEKDLFLGKI